MTGTYVSDATAPNLLSGATLNAAGTTNGTAQELSYPGGYARFHILTGTVTGTSPTLNVRIQGADDSGFSAGVVTICRFRQVGDEDNADVFASGYVGNKRYFRAEVVIAGTSPVYTGSTCVAEAPHFKRLKSQDGQ